MRVDPPPWRQVDAGDVAAPTQQPLNSVTARRRLCEHLRQTRTQASYRQQQVSDALGWSRSKLLRIEAGQVGISATDLTALLDLYGVHDQQERQQFAAVARLGRTQPWAAFRDVLSSHDRTYLSGESAASRVRQYDTSLIPDLLRTESYAWTVIKALSPPGTPTRLMQRRLEVCLARQAILSRANAPELHFVVDEAAVRRWVRDRRGDSGVRRGQLQRLYELADRPGVHIQVLPFSHGLLGGLAGSFALLGDAGDEDELAVYLTDGDGGARRASAAKMRWYERAFEDLAAASSSPHRVHAVLGTITGERDLPAALEWLSPDRDESR